MKTDYRATTRPEWLPAEMPPGYRNRLEEMQRLSRDLEEMDRFGLLLYAVGDELAEAVHQVLVAIGLDAASATGARGSAIDVTLDASRRLLVLVSASTRPIDRRSEDLAAVFQILHERAGQADRVVLVSNTDPAIRPADRPEGMTAEALNLLTRLGANHLPAPTLFGIWSRAHQDRALARTCVDRLHAQDGGAFAMPALLSV